MSPKQRSTKLFGLGCCAALLLSGVSGCANPIDAIKEKVMTEVGEKVVGQMADGADIELGPTSKLPSDFPAGIPLPNGDLGAAVSAKQDTTVRILHYSVKDGAQQFDDYRADITAKGFDEVTWSDFGGMKLGGFENGAYSVNISLLGTDEQDTVMQVMVSEK